MNRAFRVIWSKVKGKWVVVSEKISTNGIRPALTVSCIAAATVMAAASPAFALDAGTLPTGGQIVVGSGSISQSDNLLTIDQQTGRMIANWDSFNIGQDAAVRFNQPGAQSVALNRIADQNPTQILGNLSANGQVFLLNPAGIVFGESAQVDVGGLVASSLELADSDFLDGNYRLTGTGSSVLNQGQITTAEGGIVAFIGGDVGNDGTIRTPGGTTALIAGEDVTLDFSGDGLIQYRVERGAVAAQAENRGLIAADGGMVIMTAEAADALSSAVVNQEGVIEARTLQNREGKILLLADMQYGETLVSGTLDASAPNGGDGGFIETSAATVNIAPDAKISTLSAAGATGEWLIDPYDVVIAAAGGNVTGATIAAALNSTNVTIDTTNDSYGTGSNSSGTAYPSVPGAGNGDITVNDSISKTGSAATTLTLLAHNDININNEIKSSSGRLNVVLTADQDNSGSGSITFGGGGSITTKGGNFYAGKVTTVSNRDSFAKMGQDLTMGSGSFIDVGGGMLSVNINGILTLDANSLRVPTRNSYPYYNTGYRKYYNNDLTLTAASIVSNNTAASTPDITTQASYNVLNAGTIGSDSNPIKISAGASTASNSLSIINTSGSSYVAQVERQAFRNINLSIGSQANSTQNIQIMGDPGGNGHAILNTDGSGVLALETDDIRTGGGSGISGTNISVSAATITFGDASVDTGSYAFSASATSLTSSAVNGSADISGGTVTLTGPTIGTVANPIELGTGNSLYVSNTGGSTAIKSVNDRFNTIKLTNVVDAGSHSILFSGGDHIDFSSDGSSVIIPTISGGSSDGESFGGTTGIDVSRGNRNISTVVSHTGAADLILHDNAVNTGRGTYHGELTSGNTGNIRAATLYDASTPQAQITAGNVEFYLYNNGGGTVGGNGYDIEVAQGTGASNNTFTLYSRGGDVSVHELTENHFKTINLTLADTTNQEKDIQLDLAGSDDINFHVGAADIIIDASKVNLSSNNRNFNLAGQYRQVQIDGNSLGSGYYYVYGMYGLRLNGDVMTDGGAINLNGGANITLLKDVRIDSNADDTGNSASTGSAGSIQLRGNLSATGAYSLTADSSSTGTSGNGIYIYGNAAAAGGSYLSALTLNAKGTGDTNDGMIYLYGSSYLIDGDFSATGETRLYNSSSLTIDTEQGNDGAAGNITFAGENLYNNFQQSALIFDASTTAAGQDAGDVDLYGTYTHSPLQAKNLSVAASGGAGGSDGTISLPAITTTYGSGPNTQSYSGGVINLHGNLTSDRGDISLDGDVRIASSLTIDTWQTPTATTPQAGVAGSVTLTGSGVSAAASGLDLTINTATDTGTSQYRNVNSWSHAAGGVTITAGNAGGYYLDNLNVVATGAGTYNTGGNGTITLNNVATQGNQAYSGGATTLNNGALATNGASIDLSGVDDLLFSGTVSLATDLAGGSSAAGTLDLGSHNIDGAVDLTIDLSADGGGAWQDLALTAGSSTPLNSLTLKGNSVVLGVTETTGNLAVTTSNGAVTQTGELTIGGATTIDAGVGNITLANAGNDFTGAVSVSGADVSLADANDLTLGGSTVSGDLTAAALAGDLTITGNINKSAGSDAEAVFKATGSITQNSNVAISSSNNQLGVTFWADSDDTDTGGILLASNASITSNGGKILLGGGRDPYRDYAVGDAAATRNAGISLDTVNLDSGGGEITLTGAAMQAGGTNINGVYIADSTINSGSGDLGIYGYVDDFNTNTATIGLEVTGSSFLSNGDSSNFLVLDGGSYVTGGGNATGLKFTNSTAQATGGAETLLFGSYGNSSATTGTVVGLDLVSGDILSSSGEINLIAYNQKAASTGLSLGGLVTVGQKSGSAVETSTSAITLKADSMDIQGAVAASGGQLIVTPMSGGAAVSIGGGSGVLNLPVSYFANNFADGFTSITVGKQSAGDIIVEADIAYSDPLTLQGSGDIIVKSGVDLTGAAAGSDGIKSSLILWADSDGNNNGKIYLNQDTPASGSTITTNGGGLWLGGGRHYDATTWTPYAGAAPLEVGKGAAVSGGGTSNPVGIWVKEANINTGGGNIYMSGYGIGASDSGGAFDWSSGLYLDKPTINSAGGDITLKGENNNSAGSSIDLATGFMMIHGGSLTSGSGAIDISGSFGSNADFNNGAAVLIGHNPLSGAQNGNVSISSTTGAITITGNGLNGGTDTGWRHGILLLESQNDTVSISSTSGAITLEGNAAYTDASTTDTSGLQIQSESASADRIKVVSQSGTITLRGSNSQEAGSAENAVKFRTSDAVNNVRIGYDGTTAYSGDLLIEGDSLSHNPNGSVANAGLISLQGTGSLTIQSQGDAFTALRYNAGDLSFDDDWNFGTGLGQFTLGKSTNTHTINLSGVQTVQVADSGTIQIFGGTLSLIGNLSASNGTILLQSNGGTATVAGSLTADKLALLGGSTVTATNTANDVNSLAASGVGTFNYVDADDLSIGTVNPVGILATGPVTIETLTGNLTVEQDIITSDATSSAVILNAGKNTAAGTSTGGDIVITGAPSITTGAGGRATLYTGSITGSTGVSELVGEGSGNFRYNSDESATNYTAALGTGLYAIYREQPTLTYPATTSVEYGTDISSPSITPTGLVNGDTLAQAVDTDPTFNVTDINGLGTSTSGNRNVGTYGVTKTGDAVGGLGYAFAYNTSSIEVTKKSLTLDVGATTKVYDGTTTINFNGTATSTGVIGGDAVAIDTGNVTGYADANVGTEKAVTFTGFALSGADAGNYSLISGSAASTATITPKILSVSGTTAADKVYDGSDSAAISIGSLSGFVGSETVTATAIGSFDSKNAGSRTASAVYTLADGANGGLASNYQLADSSGLTATITPKTLTISGTTAVDRVYDGTTTASFNLGILSGLVGNETLGVSVSGSFDSKNAGSRIATAAYALADGANGGLAANYILADSVGLSATISPKSLSLSLGATTKVYDGTTEVDFGATTSNLTGTVGGDSISLVIDGVSGSVDDKNVGNRTATFVGFGLAGSDAGNYAIGDSYVTTAATITARTLTVTAPDVTKIYDGTTSATGAAAIVGVADVDRVNAGPMLAFDNKNAGTDNKTVSASGLTIRDADGSDMTANYSISYIDNTSSSILTKLLTVAGTIAADREYNGTTTATINVGVLSGFVGSETVTASAVGSFDSKNAGNRTATAVYTLADGANGGLAGNYQLADTSHSATITPKNLAVAGTITVDDKVYDGTIDATTDASGASVTPIGSDLVTVTATGAFADKNVGADKAITLTVELFGEDAGNYTASYAAPLTADITPKDLILELSGVANKEYDGTTDVLGSPTVSLVGIVSGDTIDPFSGSIQFEDKHVGSNKTVVVEGYTLTGADAGNYNLATDGVETTAEITQRTLSVSNLTAADKVYDGTTAATIDTGTAILDGLVDGDDFSVSSSGEFSDKNVGSGKTVSLSNSYGGTDVGNYAIIDQTGASADISAKVLTVSGISAADKVYDGNTAASTDVSGAVFSGLVGGDDLSVTASGEFSDKHVGSGKTVSLTSSYGGADAGNYAITDQASASADISAKALTVSGISAVDKVYDGSTAATTDVSGAVFSGLIGGDDLSVAASGEFSDKHVGSGKTVSLTSSYGGADAGNYAITDQASTSADISAKAMTVSGISAADKVYDGTAAAATDVSGAVFSGLIGGDDLSVSASGEFSDKHVGSGKTVSLTSSYGGADAGNYSITDQASASADISAKALTVSGISAADKVYDGTVAATTDVSGAVFTGLIGGDDLSVTASGEFSDKHVGSGKTVSLTSSYGGTDAGNYAITDQASASADISAKTLTISADALSKTYGDADPTLSYSVDAALMGGDSFTGTLSRALGEDVGAYSIGQNSLDIDDGNNGNNYAVTYVGSELTITQRAITLTADAVSKTYGDADPELSVSITAGSLASVAVTDSLEEVIGTLSRETGEEVGAYDVLLGTGSKVDNYSVSFEADNNAFEIAPENTTDPLVATVLSSLTSPQIRVNGTQDQTGHQPSGASGAMGPGAGKNMFNGDIADGLIIDLTGYRDDELDR